ncbi:MAG: hypothetical protein WAV07_03505 [Candidatus Contendobacter sp.]
MQRWGWGWTMLLSLLAAPVLAANKCVETSGRIFYQDAPCPVNTHGGDLRLNVNRPFTGQAKPPTMDGVMTVTTESEDVRRHPPPDSRLGR